MHTYARQPVAFVRGEGAYACRTPRADRTSTSSRASRSATPATAIRGSSTRSASRRSRWCTCRTCSLHAPMVRLAERLATSFEPGARCLLCNSGAEANEAAIKLARKRRRGGEISGGGGRLPRPHLRRAVRDAAGDQAGAVRAARAGLRRGAPRRRRGAAAAVTSAPRPSCSSRSRARPGCTRSPARC